jgi:DNA adenine methylase
LRPLGFTPAEFVEPFAGGAIIGLTAAAEGLAERGKLSEIDDAAAVWVNILHDEGGRSWLAERMIILKLTPESARSVLAITPGSLRQTAFQTIIKNRVNRGSTPAQGAGILTCSRWL